MADIVTPGVDLGNLLQNNPMQQSQIGLQQQGQLPLLQQETKSVAIQNQLEMFKLSMLKNLPKMLAESEKSQQPAGPTSEQTAENPQETQTGAMVAGYNAVRQPQPWSPQLQARYNKYQQADLLYKSMGIQTNFAELNVKGPYDAENLRRQQLATNEFKQFADAAEFGKTAVQTWPDSPLKSRLMAMEDADVRNMAARLANSAHALSGAKTSYNGSQAIDENSGRQIPSMPQAAMSRKDAEDAALKPMTWYSGNMKQEGPTYKNPAFGGISKEGFVSGLMRWGSADQANSWIQNQTARSSTAQAPTAPQAPAGRGAGLMAPGAGPTLVNPETKQPIDTTGMSPKDVNLIRITPNAPGLAPTGEGELNVKQTEAYKNWTTQKAKVEENLDKSSERYNRALTDNDRLRNLLSANPNLGPGSKEYTAFETFMHEWFGANPRGASATQVLQKVLGTDQLNRVLSAFHEEGAQVRLGAYETRIIMEALAANPQMTKQAITQLLDWQKSDNQYELNKVNFQKVGIEAGKEPLALGSTYERGNPRSQAITTQLTSIPPLRNVALPLTKAEVDALPPHTRFIWTDGKPYTTPGR